MRNIHYSILLLILILFLFSCTKKEKPLKLLKVTEYSSSKVSDSALIKLLKSEKNIDVEIDYTLSENFAIDQLKEKKVDLLIIPNNATSNNLDFKAVVPLLPRILMVFTNKRTEIKDIKDLLENGTVYFEDRSRLDSLFFEKLYYNFNIDESMINSRISEELELDKQSDSLLIYIGLSHINNELVKNMADHNWSLFSLDDINYYGKGSRVEGFTMMNTSAYPFIIPMSIYKARPEKSVLTVAIKDILLTRSDLDNEIVYKITEALIENKSHLIQMNSAYNLLDFNFENQVLSFPLHEGTKNFLERNKPSIWMRYVNMAWPILSILVIFIGAFTSFNRNLKKKKKESIENYYTSLLEIREKSLHIEDKSEIQQLLNELKLLRSKAIKALANNKFDSGESFNIFLALYTEIKDDLIEDITQF